MYCKVAWDYTLQVFGPATAQKKDAAFELRVYGVAMNLHAAAGNFGVGLTNSTYWGTDKKLTEFKLATDTTMAFTLPATTDTVTASSDYVALQLPYQWMG